MGAGLHLQPYSSGTACAFLCDCNRVACMDRRQRHPRLGSLTMLAEVALSHKHTALCCEAWMQHDRQHAANAVLPFIHGQVQGLWLQLPVSWP